MKPYKNIAICILLAVAIALSSGCSTVKKVFGKSSAKETKAKAKIENVDSQIGGNIRDQLNQISSITYGVGYALEKEPTPSKNVEVAKDLNTRAMSLSGVPTLEEINKMKQMVDDLTSQLQTEKTRGKAALDDRDNQIVALQLEAKMLGVAKDNEIKKYMQLAADTASKADATQAELNDYKGWFGLKAVGKGLWQFIKSSTWFLLGGSIIFIVLRFASMSNPIAASIFGIFEHAVSWVINTISILFPKALAIAGHVTKKAYDEVSGILQKLIDNIQSIKEIEKKTGKDATLKEVLEELGKSFDQSEKDIVDKIKKDLGYTK